MNVSAEETKCYTLEEVIYLYYAEKKGYSDYKETGFDEMKEEDGEKHRKFRIDYKNANNNFNDILKIFALTQFTEHWKKQNGGYQFDKDEAEFLSELLFRYSDKKIWKLIKKVNNQNFDGFIKIYREQNGEELMAELEFVIKGFLEICENREGRESDRYMQVENTLRIYTQYYQLQWIRQMQDAIYSVPTLTVNDVEHSVGGCILGDFQMFLRETGDTIKNMVEDAKVAWGEKKQKCREEFDGIEFDDETVYVVEHIISLMKESNLKAGEMFEDDYRQNEPRHIPKDEKEGRNNKELVRKEFEKAYSKLSKNEIIKLGSSFFEK